MSSQRPAHCSPSAPRACCGFRLSQNGVPQALRDRISLLRFYEPSYKTLCLALSFPATSKSPQLDMVHEDRRRSAEALGADPETERSTVVGTPRSPSLNGDDQQPLGDPAVSAQELDYVPDGGREAWTVVLGACLALFASAGMINAYVSICGECALATRAATTLTVKSCYREHSRITTKLRFCRLHRRQRSRSSGPYKYSSYTCLGPSQGVFSTHTAPRSALWLFTATPSPYAH